MKTVADFPAFEVIDLEQDVIELSYDDLNSSTTGMKFCVSQETIRHGNLYPQVSPGCVAYYAMQYNEDPVEKEARAVKLGHELYWLNNCGACISDTVKVKGVRFLLKPGQKIKMNGVLLQVKHLRGEYYSLVKIAE